MIFSLLILAAALVACFGQSDEFKSPWQNEKTALLIDPYQGNDFDWEKLKTDKRVAGIIHRATIGDRADTKYAERRAAAKKHGYLWGSYHLGLAGDPVAQADFYLKTVDPGDDELIALDIEGLGGSNMTLEDAEKFIGRIRKKTGRYPVLYANQTVVVEISKKYSKDSVFAKTPLWYARFRASVTDFPTTVWPGYTIWQFASEINCAAEKKNAAGKTVYDCGEPARSCPCQVAGTDRCMDVNVFNGTVRELKRKFPFTRR